METSFCRLYCFYILLFTPVVFVSGNIVIHELREPSSPGKVIRTRGRERASVSTSLVTDVPHPNGKSANRLDSLLLMLLNKDWAETENKPKPLVYPYSKELIRLHGNGGFFHSGLVEVYRAGHWGYVCDDRWDLKDATVACKQLGFTRGAVSVSDVNATLSEIQRSSATILMDDVQCFGTESSLHECSYNALNDCTLDEVAGVTCYTNEGCPKGWVSGFGKCYKFYAKAKTIKLAASICARDNASLLTIDSIEENHFLSNILKNSVPHIHQWYTGGKRMKKRWQWNKYVAVSNKNSKTSRKKSKSKNRQAAFKTVKSAVSFDRWFPGWPSFDNKYAEPAGKKGHDCLTLSDVYTDPGTESSVVVDYFYWKADTCTRNDGIYFICQTNTDIQEKVSNQDCYNDNGSSYRGNVEVTESGSHCLSWSLSSKLNERTHPGKGLGDHNFCRNPDNDTKPWCWVSHVHRKFGFCKLSQCSEVVVTTGSPTDKSDLSPLNCPAREFYCSSQKVCIPGDFRCDNEKDCMHGEDEVGCVYALNHFNKTPDSSLSVFYNRRPYASESYREISDEMCAKKCAENKNFICKSFVYDARRRTCDLSKWISSDLLCRIMPSAIYDYYELKQDSDCSGKFLCADKKCIEMSSLCDGKDDCKDKSDEHNCELQVRLVGGKEHSGTVEITYKGATGVICDDEWSLEDATVICRMLGYRGAMQTTELNFYNYPLKNVNIILDDVNCKGNETSIKDCEKISGSHDCSALEIAGVMCRLSKVCEVEQFKCKNDLCVSAEELCDKNDDCGDNSDEYDCHSVNFQLVNGSAPSEGRVEVTRNGFRGTVCDDGWDDKDAAVLCRKLGFIYGGRALNNGFFGSGTGPIWLDDVQCSGNEVSLEQCPNKGWAKHDCDHREDAGVKCYDRPTTQTSTTTMKTTRTTTVTTQMTTVISPTSSTATIKIKLVGGRDASEGNVEVVIDNVKYRVCDDNWDNKDATVVCKMLGYSGGGVATTTSLFGSDLNDIIFDEVNCDGTESEIGKCLAFVGVKKHDCNSNELAGAVCDKDSTPIKQPGGSLTNETFIAGTCGKRPYDHTDFAKPRIKRHNPFTTILPDTPKYLEKLQQMKIVGGNYAQHGAYPWQARVHQVFNRNFEGGVAYGTHHCGAAVISEFYLLSAAHCFVGRRKDEFIMVVGDHSQKLKDFGEQIFQVEDIIAHEQYSDATKDNDIALIKIKPTREGRGIEFNNYVQPACLPDSRTPFVEGTKCWISGWGNSKPTGSYSAYPDILKAVEVPLVGQRQCERLYNKQMPAYLSQRMLCAGYIKGGKDSCDGDSGGPLICKIADAYTVIGITSWGRGCALANLPGVYTRVSTFTTWMDQKIRLYSKTNAERTLPTKL